MKRDLYVMSSWPTSCLNGFEAAGLDKNKIIASAHVTPDFLDEPYAKAKDVVAIFIAAGKMHGPSIGLDSRLGIVPNSLGCLSLALMMTNDIRSGIGIMVKHASCLTNTLEFFFDDRKSDPFFGFNTKEGIDLTPLVIDSVIATCIRTFRFLRPRDNVIRSVDIIFPKPKNAKPYEDYFKVPIQWGAKQYGFHLAPEFLDIPSIYANPLLLKQQEQVCIDQIIEIEDTTVLYKLRRSIEIALDIGNVSIQQVAQSLDISVRVLQRQLTQYNTNFKKEHEKIQKERAKRYLVTTKLPIVDIAHRLNFSDSGNFSRAFNRWFGCSPAQYRCKLNYKDSHSSQNITRGTKRSF